jgi:5-oxoprolinase (ATP-hydrolysing) subunit C
MNFLEVVAVRGPSMVQDAGRPGRMAQGIPPGGALVPELLAFANRAAGNRWDSPAIEAFAPMKVRLDGASRWVIAGSRLAWLRSGEELTLEASPSLRAQYLAVEGGLEVPEVMGGRGTLLVAGLGGHLGRLLRAGDRIALGAGAAGREAKDASPADLERRAALLGDATAQLAPRSSPAIRVVAFRGPGSPLALEPLLRRTFRVSPRSDRVGLRLEGELGVAGPADLSSAPMTWGAIQVPPSGEPVILGPDHPTTGGYALIGCVVRSDLGRLFAQPPGTQLGFTEVAVEEARALWRAHRELHFRACE